MSDRTRLGKCRDISAGFKTYQGLEPAVLAGRRDKESAGGASMNLIYTHPKFSNPFGIELNRDRDADPAVRDAVNRAIKWVIEYKAEKHLYQALSLTTKPKPVDDASGHPSLWLCPPPGGQGKHVGMVMALDERGHVRCYASNQITQPVKEDHPTCAKKFISEVSGLRSADAINQLIQQTVNAAFSDQADLAEKACREAAHYRTMAVFIVVLSADKPLVFMTTLVIHGPQQTNLKHAFTGKVAP